MSFTSALPTKPTYSCFKNLGLPFAFRMPILLSATNAKSKTFLLMLIFSVFFNTGCGGTPDHAVDDSSGNHYSQTSNASYAAEIKSAASSFTVNPAENFNGFNPEVWNSQQSWVECNCGNNKPAEPQIMTWNPNT
ncbi:hypothetical protein Q8A64_14485 [Oxalobacteraceae bacterium R-40]|uniref:Uncharacterized protein n=1 Tax=Keguizhuia sedimenti TaxID=3064264 RepID=A0ABU1BU82_9BURK|nr:hypothetical protein [Oxalobacteraceae bacterium R-40]